MKMKIVIAGAGRGGLNLAVHLQNQGHTVLVLERDPAVAKLATEAYGIVALTGDATDAATLRQAGPERADAVLAMLHRDADNLGVALLARALGAKRLIVRMRDPSYRTVYEDVGVRQILSETEILVGVLATAIEFEAVRHSMVLGSGEAIAVELTIPERAWVVGRAVSEIAARASFPKSCVVAGMSKNGAIQAPRGASVVEGAMDLLIVCAREDLATTVDFFLSVNEPR
ncbi:MAG TPA: TrkA family potassium uptake protein [Labilithrix sp.]|jgi:trk system potassium uptake protein TrkA|nr:TrkA family potassium uptake protein [Labilithrix sp.]